jgi:heme-degrading monooxygenase HmoA
MPLRRHDDERLAIQLARDDIGGWIGMVAQADRRLATAYEAGVARREGPHRRAPVAQARQRSLRVRQEGAPGVGEANATPPALDDRLMEVAREVDGFLGIESCIHGNFTLAVSYWRSLDAIEAWRRHAQHRLARELGKTRWFESYVTRIAKVERAY